MDRDFGHVSPWLYDLLGKPRGVAHTDLVKCSSKSWPPPKCSGKAVRNTVANCADYLKQQIEGYRPRLIVCNGAKVSEFIQTMIRPAEPLGRGTSYRGSVNGVDVWIVLSGFIGRIDNYARIRLGQEIERIAADIGVKV